MNHFAVLDVCAPDHVRAQALARELRGLGIDTRLGPLPTGPCLRFEMAQGAQRAVCLVEANRWAEVHLPGIAGLDWQAMPNDLVAGLTAIAQPLRLHDPVLGPLPWVASAPTCVLPPACPLPVIAGDAGPVWIEALEGRPPAGPATLRGDLLLQLDLQLGTLSLTPRQLRRLHRHAIVVLHRPHALAWHAGQALFHYHLHPEAITVNDIAHADLDIPPLDAPAGDGLLSRHQIADLPLSVQVHLCELPLTVAELSALEAGSVLPLPDGAYKHLQLRHAGRLLATGALVQIGDELGIALSQVPGQP